MLYCESHDLDHGYFAKEDHYDVEYNYEYMRLREKVFFNTTQITDQKDGIPQIGFLAIK